MPIRTKHNEVIEEPEKVEEPVEATGEVVVDDMPKLEDMKVAELRELGKKLEVEGVWAARKDKLVKMIKKTFKK